MMLGAGVLAVLLVLACAGAAADGDVQVAEAAA
jgi:hypothetical protein